MELARGQAPRELSDLGTELVDRALEPVALGADLLRVTELAFELCTAPSLCFEGPLVGGNGHGQIGTLHLTWIPGAAQAPALWNGTISQRLGRPIAALLQLDEAGLGVLELRQSAHRQAAALCTELLEPIAHRLEL